MQNASNAFRRAAPTHPAMVYAVPQKLTGIFPPVQSLSSGTAFPELSKPMNGEYPRQTKPVDQQQALSFAAWELRLYLDTHPDDEQALGLFGQLCQNMNAPSYACTFAPCAGHCASQWRWVDDPWPWELAANERKG